MTREELLEKAKQTVCKDREDQYGPPENSFGTIAEFWTTYINAIGNGKKIDFVESEDIAAMMILLKIARNAHCQKVDNWVDISGYAACGVEVATQEHIKLDMSSLTEDKD